MTKTDGWPVDADHYDAQELLRAWFHWWRTANDVPAHLPDGLHVKTTAYLAAQAVAEGRKIYGPGCL